MLDSGTTGRGVGMRYTWHAVHGMRHWHKVYLNRDRMVEALVHGVLNLGLHGRGTWDKAHSIYDQLVEAQARGILDVLSNGGGTGPRHTVALIRRPRHRPGEYLTMI